MTAANVAKVVAGLIAVLIAIKIIGEVLSFLTSAWFIVLAVGVWYVVRRRKQSQSL